MPTPAYDVCFAAGERTFQIQHYANAVLGCTNLNSCFLKNLNSAIQLEITQIKKEADL